MGGVPGASRQADPASEGGCAISGVFQGIAASRKWSRARSGFRAQRTACYSIFSAASLLIPNSRETASPCCMDRGCGRTEPDPCSGLCDADILWASQVQHTVQYVGRDRHLARLTPVRLEAQPVTDDALPARYISLHQGAPVIP